MVLEKLSVNFFFLEIVNDASKLKIVYLKKINLDNNFQNTK